MKITAHAPCPYYNKGVKRARRARRPYIIKV